MERFAEEHGFASKKLYTNNPGKAKSTVDALFTNAEFLQYNNEQHNRFRSAITKLLALLESSKTPFEQLGGI